MTKDETGAVSTANALKMAISFASVISETYATGGEAEKVINACKEALEQPDCNSHPKAPHGFNRDASHSADRYVCDCEGWDAWQDGYDEGLRKGLALEQQTQPLSDDEIEQIVKEMFVSGHFTSYNPIMFARAIEAAHGIGE
jgi:hypothetical protein